MCEKDSRYDDGDDDQQREEKVRVMRKRQKRQVLAGIYQLHTRVVRSRIIKRLGDCPPSMIETRAPQGSTLDAWRTDREGLVPRRRDTRVRSSRSEQPASAIHGYSAAPVSSGILPRVRNSQS